MAVNAAGPMSLKNFDYSDVVAALVEELHAFDKTLSGLSPDEWSASTKLVPPVPSKPPWDVRTLADHLDIATHMAAEMAANPQDLQIARDHVSFYIFDRSTVGPAVYQYTVEHAGDRSSAAIHSSLQRTIREAIEVARTASPELVAPAYFGPMKLRDMVITRVVEALVHGIDLADALGRPPYATAQATAVVAATLDELLGRTAYPGRPADLRDDDLAFVRVATGRQEYPDPRFPLGL
jgi:uncharacterized protein (TIGR03083 family)